MSLMEYPQKATLAFLSTAGHAVAWYWSNILFSATLIDSAFAPQPGDDAILEREIENSARHWDALTHHNKI